MPAVENLVKRHDDFSNTLQAQDKSVAGLNDMANGLVKAKHPDSKQ